MTTYAYVGWGLVAAVAIGFIVYVFLGKGEDVRRIDPSKQGKTGAPKGSDSLKSNSAKTAQLSALREKLADQAQSSAEPLKKTPSTPKNKSSSIPPKAVAAVTPLSDRFAPETVEPTQAPLPQAFDSLPTSSLTPTQPSRSNVTTPADEASWTPTDELSPRGALHIDTQALAEEVRRQEAEEAEKEAAALAEAQERVELERVVMEASDALMASATPPVINHDAHALPAAKMLILLVDDSKVVRVKTEKLLSNMGYDVATAVDGMDALAQLEILKPGLIITDIEMPNLDGFGLVRSVRGNAFTAEIPIIVMTSHVNLHLDIAATEGINGFLPKPFLDQDLLDQVAFLAQE